jgi:pimeloyl-ACP methyl ester carboxylesterase
MPTPAAKQSIAKQWASSITSAAAKPLKHLHPSDLRAAAQLATTATASVARMAEGVNQAVWSTLGAPSGKTADQTRGITGLAFQSVQGITALVGKGLDTAFAKLAPFIARPDATPVPSQTREAVLAALNGVLGDHLAATGNALATQMTLRFDGSALDWQAMPPKTKVTGKVLLLVHGLCMNDLQWRNVHAAGTAGARVVDHGATLATALGYTPVYLRYNTGLHTSVNGHELSEQLAQLVQHWPKRISDLTIVVHSMGGLVTRSAVHTAQATQAAWIKKLKSIVFLGTPHHGAMLEKAGNWVDIILGSTPYSKPFAKIAQLRSAGITDLRYGHVLDADWVGKDRFRRQPDSRQIVPLPAGLACYTVAGTTAAQRSTLSDRLVGDGLVTLPSALGQHTDASRSLVFAKASQRIVYRTNHMQLLSSDEVGAQLVAWLGR